MKSILALILLAIVSGMPTFNAYAEAETATGTPAREIVVVLDNSQSMKANDASQIGKRVVQHLLKQSSQQLRVEAVLFDNDVKVIRPLSDSPPADMTAELAPINYKGALTNIPVALERAVYDLKMNGKDGAFKSVVLITDGVIDTGNKVRDAEGARWIREELAADAAKNGIALFSIALSDRTDFQLLQSLAVNTGGEYFRAYSADEAAVVLNRINDVSLLRLASKPETASETPTPEVPVAEPAAAAQAMAPAEPVAAEDNEPASAIESLPAAEPTEPAGQMEPLATEPAPSADEFAEDSSESPSVWGETSALLLGVAVLTVLIALITFFARSLRRERKPAVSEEPPPGEPSMPDAYLRDVSGVTNQDRFRLDHRLSVIGRIPPANGRQVGFLHLERGSIGRYHAFIEYKENGFVLGDQQSMNGTYINGVRVLGEQRLRHRDRIKFHNLEFEFIIPEMDHADETVLIPAVTLSEDTTVTSRRAAAALSAIVNKPAVGVATVAAAATAANIRVDTPESDNEEPGTETLSLPPVANGSFLELGEGYTLPSSRAVKIALDEYFEEHCDA